jgi:H+/gluconate symporter-like permease
MYRLVGLFSMLFGLIGFSKFLKYREQVEDNDGKIDEKAKNSFLFSVYILLISIALLISTIIFYLFDQEYKK